MGCSLKWKFQLVIIESGKFGGDFILSVSNGGRCFLISKSQFWLVAKR